MDWKVHIIVAFDRHIIDSYQRHPFINQPSRGVGFDVNEVLMEPFARKIAVLRLEENRLPGFDWIAVQFRHGHGCG